MKLILMTSLLIGSVWQVGTAQEGGDGNRGDPDAIAAAREMVETMGGIEIWAQLGTVHFVHEWYPWNRVDSYVENEILDLTGPRSWVDRKSEIHRQIRAYSPEGGHWSISDGEFKRSSDEVRDSALERAPFNFYRLVKAVAIEDPFYELRFGEGDIPGTRRIEFLGPDGIMRGWVILNAKMEPIVKATPQYRYTLGPLRRFGNLRVPGWGVYDNGTTRFEMISLSADRQPPDSTLFLPPTSRN
ncbi:MAG: hypothetical protein JJE01_01135 [Gemmatimonadetes bacterium]|nr:hypothetical protein [Gemmatimonadota bacterium]